MAHSISVSDDGLYVIGVPDGDLTRESAVEISRAMYERGMELGISCFLLDAVNARNLDAPLENTRFTRDDVPGIMPLETCFVVLADPVDRSHDFHVAFAQTQGVDISLFQDRTEAIEHLQQAAKRLGGSASSSSPD